MPAGDAIQVLRRHDRADTSQGTAGVRAGILEVYRPDFHHAHPGEGGLAAFFPSRRVLVGLKLLQ